MAKKKEEALELGTALTVDGCEVTEVQNVVIEEVKYISGKIGEANFYWFTDGKRHTGIEDPKDLI
jgi:hypothetical protein